MTFATGQKRTLHNSHHFSRYRMKTASFIYASIFFASALVPMSSRAETPPFEGTFAHDNFLLDLVQIGNRLCGVWVVTSDARNMQGAVAGVIAGKNVTLNYCEEIWGNPDVSSYVCDAPVGSNPKVGLNLFRFHVDGKRLYSRDPDTGKRVYVERLKSPVDRTWSLLGDVPKPKYLEQCAAGKISR